MPSTSTPTSDTLAAFKAQLERNDADKAELLAAAEELASERDAYRELYLQTLEL